MKNIRRTQVFQELERVQGPKLEPLRPKSRAQEGQARSNKVAGGVAAVKVGLVRLDRVSGLWSGMERDGTGAQPEGGQRQKST